MEILNQDILVELALCIRNDKDAVSFLSISKMTRKVIKLDLFWNLRFEKYIGANIYQDKNPDFNSAHYYKKYSGKKPSKQFTMAIEDDLLSMVEILAENVARYKLLKSIKKAALIEKNRILSFLLKYTKMTYDSINNLWNKTHAIDTLIEVFYYLVKIKDYVTLELLIDEIDFIFMNKLRILYLCDRKMLEFLVDNFKYSIDGDTFHHFIDIRENSVDEKIEMFDKVECLRILRVGFLISYIRKEYATLEKVKWMVEHWEIIDIKLLGSSEIRLIMEDCNNEIWEYVSSLIKDVDSNDLAINFMLAYKHRKTIPRKSSRILKFINNVDINAALESCISNRNCALIEFFLKNGGDGNIIKDHLVRPGVFARIKKYINRRRCNANNKKGVGCKNFALYGDDKCRVHTSRKWDHTLVDWCKDIDY